MAENTAEAYSNEPGPRAARTLKNAALGLLSRLEDTAIDAEALRRFHAADNMTDQIAALASLASRDCPERAEALDAFYERWKHDPLIMNKWLGIQAGAALPGNVKNVVALTKHPRSISRTRTRCTRSSAGSSAARPPTSTRRTAAGTSSWATS